MKARRPIAGFFPGTGRVGANCPCICPGADRGYGMGALPETSVGAFAETAVGASGVVAYRPAAGSCILLIMGDGAGMVGADNGCGVTGGICVAGVEGGTIGIEGGTAGRDGGAGVGTGPCAISGAGIADKLSSQTFCTGGFCSCNRRLLHGASTVASGSAVGAVEASGVPGRSGAGRAFVCQPPTIASTSAAHVGGRACELFASPRKIACSTAGGRAGLNWRGAIGTS